MSEHRMQNTRESILIAARDVFMKKGYAGARMQEIANEAGINKALLHYYFKNKIRFFCNWYIGFLQSNTYLVSFILHEINQDPEKLVQYFTRAGLKAPKQLMIQMEMEAQKGNIRKVDPLQMILNILSLCVFPFVARPIVKGVFRLQDKEYNDLIEMPGRNCNYSFTQST